MLELKNVYKTYSSKNGVTHRALENVSLKFNSTGLVFILGKSGSGKSTLLNLIGGLDNFDRGDIVFDGQSFLHFKESDFDYYRNSCVGFVFQDFNLLDNLTVFENVAIALDLQSKKDNEKVLKLLDDMGLSSLKNRRMDELSGGQKQRVSIARALIKNPKIILADEPTGSLDSETSDATIKILCDLAIERLVVIVTHNKELAYAFGDRIIEIRDGFVLKDLMRKKNIIKEMPRPTLVSSNLVIVPKNQQIDQVNIDNLNVTINEKRQDYYLLVDSNKHLAMSLYPNVKEVIDDDNNEETFEPFVYKDDSKEQNDEKFKSNLSIKKAISFSMSNLKKKKLRLFFTILLAILSVILTGTAINFTQYSLTKSIANSLKKDNGSYVEVSSSFSLQTENYALQKGDINYLNSLERDIAYEYNQPFIYSIIDNGSLLSSAMSKDILFNKKFSGFLTCDSIENYGYGSNNFKIIYEKNNLTDEDYDNGIYISSIIANVMVRYINEYGSRDYKNKFNVENISDLIGVNLPTTSQSAHGITTFNFKIIGIYDIDEDQDLYKKYAKLYEDPNNMDLYNEYQELSKSILTRMIVKPQFMEHLKQSYPNFVISSTINSLLGTEISTNYISSIAKFAEDAKEETTYEIGYLFTDPSFNEENFEEKIKEMKPNQVFVGRNLFQKLASYGSRWPSNDLDIIRDIGYYNNTKSTLNITNSNGIYQSVENVEIIGIIDRYVPGSANPVSSSSNTIYLAKDVFDILSDNYYCPSKALVKTNKGENLVKLIDNLYDNGFTIENEFVEYFVSFASAIEKYSTLINIVAIIWFVVVAILLYSFISSSVKDSSKQIGILKALGANIKDIYKIYAVEAMLIGLFATVFGVLGYYIIGMLINQIITSAFYTFYFPIFNFELFGALVMIFSTFIIIIISLTIPMARIKNIKPIDVINKVN